MPESTLTTALGSHFIWQPPARDIAILLNLEVVDRLQKLVKGSRGEEVGGVLLGRCEYADSVSERRIVTIEDFEEIGSEHVRGPAYSLSPQDRKGLDRVLMRIRRRDEIAPVGFFRSHLRKGIYLDEADFSLFRTHFSGPCDVFLVARPEADGPPVAGFFIWEDDTLERRSSYSQFPLDRARLETRVPVGEMEPAVASEAPVSNREGVPPAPPRKSAPPVRMSTRVVSTALRRPRIVIENPRFAKRAIYGTLGVLMVLTALAWAAIMHSTVTAGNNSPASSVALNVERGDGGLVLHWSPGGVEQAKQGVLWISDGGRRSRFDLTRDRLASGTFAYSPTSDDVSFRLDLTGGTRAKSESVHYAGGRQEAPMAQVAETAPPRMIAPVRETPTPTPAATPDEARKEDAREQVEQADRGTPQVENPSPQRPPELVARAEPAPEPRIVERDRTPERPVEQAPPPRPQIRREPIVSINTEPVPPLRNRSWMRKVPLIRVLDRDRSEDFVPARVIRQVTPHVPARLVREVPADARVDVKMTIDTEGFVDRIELLSDNSDRRLAEIASEALSHWRFEPARMDSKVIKSQMIVFVRFRNPG